MTFMNTLKHRITALCLPAALMLAAALPAWAEDSNPALWKLTDADSEIWLFGTVHVLNPDLNWHTEKVGAAFTEAATLIVEAPVANADPAEMQALVRKYGLNEAGVSFMDLISEEAMANTRAAMAMVGVPEAALAQFAPLRPWVVAVTLQTLRIQSQGGNPDAGVDNVLWHEAVAKGKDIGYLETLDQQMNIFGGLTHEQEIAFYEDGVQQFVADPDQLEEIISFWKTGDMEGLAQKMQESMGFQGQDALYARLLTDRNQDWAQQIKTLMDGSGKIFIAVGAAHLAGRGSVQDQLAALGLTPVRQ